MLCIKYDDLLEKIVQWSYGFRKVETWEELLAMINNEVPMIDAVPAWNYRVPSTEEWMERYCTKKQLAGYEARKEKADV